MKLATPRVFPGPASASGRERIFGRRRRLDAGLVSLKLRIFGSKFWPKATFTVAWGNAPGTRANIGRLAEGHSHRPAAGNVSMAFGQKKPDDTVVLGRCPRLRWEQAFGQTLAGLPNSQLRSLVLLVVCVAWTGLAAGELPPTSSVTPELYATGFAFAEGPTFDLQGNLYAVNYRELGTIGMVTPDGTASIWCDLNKASPVEGRKVQANGLKIDSEGRLIVADAGGGRVLRISPDGRQVEVLADRCEGVRFNSINDVALDRLGNIFFTDPGTSSAENPVGAVYRYDIGTKKTMRLAAGLAYPNGIGVTPDQQHLCVAESDRYRLLIFPLDAAAGQVGDPRVLIDFPQETRDGIQGGKFAPDGFVFDALGRLFVAMWVGGVINVVEVPSGTLVRQYDAGGTQATNCHFHGTYLYTTVAAKEAVFRLKLGVEGHEYWALRSTGRQEGQVPVRVKE